MMQQLLQLLLQHIRQGQRSENGFENKVYRDIASAIVDDNNTPVSNKQVEDKIAWFKGRFMIWKAAKGASGFR